MVSGKLFFSILFFPLQKMVMTSFSGLLPSQISKASKLMKVILVYPTYSQDRLSAPWSGHI